MRTEFQNLFIALYREGYFTLISLWKWSEICRRHVTLFT